MKCSLVLMGAFALLLGGLGTAKAQLSLTFLPDTVSGVPGNTVTFSGTLTNTGGSTLFLNGDTPSLIGAGLTLDDSKFALNAPLSLGPGASTGSIELFDVTIDPATALGSYPGTFTISGGADASAQDTLAIGSFTVVVSAGTPAVPEPGSIATMGIGGCLLGVGFANRRRARKAG